MDSYDRYKMSARMMMLGMLALADGMQSNSMEEDPNKRLQEEWDKKNRGISSGYGVHLSKAERKGKTPQELQAMRAARIKGAPHV
jgi:hypothetical protein